MSGITGTTTNLEHVDVLVVGAGLTGIGMGYHLKTLQPDKTFAIVEARDAIGGTWDLFRYPGIRSDADLHTFGFGFKPWTRDNAIADGGEILDYLQETIDENDLARHLHLGHKVVSADFVSEEARWTVTVERTSDGAQFAVSCGMLFSAAGYYDPDNGYTPHFAGRGGLPRRDRAPAALARRPRLRRQEGRRHRERCHGRDPDPRAGRDRGPRHDAAALTVVRDAGAAPGPDRQHAAPPASRQGGVRDHADDQHQQAVHALRRQPAVPEPDACAGAQGQRGRASRGLRRGNALQSELRPMGPANVRCSGLRPVQSHLQRHGLGGHRSHRALHHEGHPARVRRRARGRHHRHRHRTEHGAIRQDSAPRRRATSRPPEPSALQDPDGQ